MECLQVIDSHWMDTQVMNEFNELTVEENLMLELEATQQEYSRRSISALQINKNKNRYIAYRPLDETRVVLETISGIEGSDYINASFISGEGPNASRCYIACQAPMDSTTIDFWRMIWEQRCGVIVMVTDLEENKALKYWPDEGQVLRFGSLLICNKKNFKLGEIEVRSLLIKGGTPGNEDTREVIHLQYRDWPDFCLHQAN